jgi:D-glycero-alpha-D-manno-heptose-7-phosphate kinase
VTAFEATAPCRVDLAGGGLDVWPVYLFHPDAVTVSVAIDRRAWCRVETGTEGVRLESKDTLAKAEGATVAAVLDARGLSGTAHVLHALGVETGLRIVTQSRVPAGAGLGESAALAVATAAGVCRALGRNLDPDVLAPLLRDAEVRGTGALGGVQDYQTAFRGGPVALHLEPGVPRAEALAVDPARIEECLLLVDSGRPPRPPRGGGEVVRGHVEGDERVRACVARVAGAARGVREALVEGRVDDVTGLLVEEWEARKQLAPALTTPEVDRVVAAAREAGGAARACGAGEGGVVAIWAPPGRRGPGPREAVERDLAAAGFRVFPARVDLRGLEVD